MFLETVERKVSERRQGVQRRNDFKVTFQWAYYLRDLFIEPLLRNSQARFEGYVLYSIDSTTLRGIQGVRASKRRKRPDEGTEVVASRFSDPQPLRTEHLPLEVATSVANSSC